MARGDERADDDGVGGGHELRDDREAAAVDAVGEDAGEGGDDELAHASDEGEHAQLNRRVGELEDKPAAGDLFHPAGDLGERRAGQKPAELPGGDIDEALARKG